VEQTNKGIWNSVEKVFSHHLITLIEAKKIKKIQLSVWL